MSEALSGNGIKAIRNKLMIEKSLHGASVKEIAGEFGLVRQTVSEILNSEQAKDFVKEIDKRVGGQQITVCEFCCITKTAYNSVVIENEKQKQIIDNLIKRVGELESKEIPI